MSRFHVEAEVCRANSVNSRNVHWEQQFTASPCGELQPFGQRQWLWAPIPSYQFPRGAQACTRVTLVFSIGVCLYSQCHLGIQLKEKVSL